MTLFIHLSRLQVCEIQPCYGDEKSWSFVVGRKTDQSRFLSKVKIIVRQQSEGQLGLGRVKPKRVPLA